LEEDENGGLSLLECLMQDGENEGPCFGFCEQMLRKGAKLSLMLLIESISRNE